MPDVFFFFFNQNFPDSAALRTNGLQADRNTKTLCSFSFQATLVSSLSLSPFSSALSWDWLCLLTLHHEEWNRWSDVNGFSEDCDKNAQLFSGATRFPIVIPVYTSVCDRWIEVELIFQHLLTGGGVDPLKIGYTLFFMSFLKDR